MKRFIVTSALACVLVAGPKAASEFLIRPFVQSITKESAAICFSLPNDAVSRTVIGTADNAETAVYTAHESLVKARFTGLNPETKYYYTVSVNGTELLSPPGEYYFFTGSAALETPVTIAVYGDTRSGEESFDLDHRSVVESIRHYSSPDLLLHTGDVVNTQDPEGWNRFFHIEHELLKNTPLYPVRGNSDGDRTDILHMFALPGDTTWYSFSAGPVYCIALDLQNNMTDSYYAKHIGPASDQWNWLTRMLASDERKRCPFTLVYFHAPLFPPDDETSPAMKDHLVSLFEKSNVDLVINGQHYFSYAQRNGVTYMISGGGGALLDRYQAKRSASVRVYEPVFHHLRITANYPALTIEAIDNAGTVFFSHSIIASSPSPGKEQPQPGLTENRIPLHIFGSSGCAECDLLKNVLLPEIEKSLAPYTFSITFYDTDIPEHYERFLVYESRLGDRKHTLPALLYADRILSGPELDLLSLKEFFKSRVMRQDKNSVKSLGSERYPMYLYFILVAAGIGLFVFIKKRNG